MRDIPPRPYPAREHVVQGGDDHAAAFREHVLRNLRLARDRWRAVVLAGLPPSLRPHVVRHIRPLGEDLLLRGLRIARWEEAWVLDEVILNTEGAEPVADPDIPR